MKDSIEELYRHVAVHATADAEHEAAVELLLLVMYADGRLSADELDEIRVISEDAGWETDTFSFDQHFGEAITKVRSALREVGGVADLLADIDARVVSSVLRRSLFSAARDVAGVDHDVDLDEATILGQIAARFG
ncbi:MAG: hypothetical protein WAS51_16350 [Ilumatobacteraceae bacterium]|nr:MAG: hypothetical protein IPM43_05110 [Actinomycetota bacterium]